jgi:Zn-dependent protease
MNALPEILHEISYKGLPLLFAIVLHECAHGWVAYRCGDPTAKLQGRLTMNPLAHIDPFGSVVLPLLCLLMPGGFVLGWAKPVPVDPRLMHQPRRDMALVAAAGPGMNLVLAIGSALLFTILLSLDGSVAQYWSSTDETPQPQSLLTMVTHPLAVMAMYSIFINVFLMLFNLIPIPPLDGGRVLTSLLPPRPALALMRLEPYGMFVLVALIMFDPQIRFIYNVAILTQTLSGSIWLAAMGLGAGTTP